MAFATSVVADPDGKYPLGTSGSGYLSEYDSSINYHADKFSRYLDECLGRLKRLREVAGDTSLSFKDRADKLKQIQSEIMRSLADANKHAR